jgi:hypothetical protein
MTINASGISKRQAKIQQRIFVELVACPSRLLGFDDHDSNDEKLRELCVGLGQLAGGVHQECNTRRNLVRVASFTLGWMGRVRDSELPVFDLIHVERERQRTLLGQGQILFTLDSRVVDARRKLRIVVEEAGEVAAAIDKLEESPRARRRRHDLLDELTQMAACCVAWLETPDLK